MEKTGVFSLFRRFNQTKQGIKLNTIAHHIWCDENGSKPLKQHKKTHLPTKKSWKNPFQNSDNLNQLNET
jgi:hypothetical protein